MGKIKAWIKNHKKEVFMTAAFTAFTACGVIVGYDIAKAKYTTQVESYIQNEAVHKLLSCTGACSKGANTYVAIWGDSIKDRSIKSLGKLGKAIIATGIDDSGGQLSDGAEITGAIIFAKEGQ